MAEEQAPATEEVAQEQPVEQEVSRETSEPLGEDGQIMERPDIIPEKFWDSETGEINLENMANSYNELEKFVSGKKDDMRESIIAEITEEARAMAPENAGDYKLPPLVEGVTEEMVEDNPLTGWWREQCHERGFTQEEFEDGINKYIDTMMGDQPNMEAEAQKLGENANDRINAVTAWAQSFFPPEEFETVAMTLGQTAEGVQVLERMQQSMAASSMRSDQVAQPERELTMEDVKEMMNDKRYFDSRFRDKAYVDRVDAAWDRLNLAGKI